MLRLKSRSSYAAVALLLALAVPACSSDESEGPAPDGAGGTGGNAGSDAGSDADNDAGDGSVSEAGDAGDGSVSEGGDADAATPAADKFLYVWAGPAAGAPGMKATNDLVLVMDIDPASSTYKKVLQTVDVGSSNNEPHHGGFCGDKLIVSGIFTGRVVVYTADATTGKLTFFKEIAPGTVPFSTPDDAVCIGNNVLMSWTGDAMGGSPGAIIEYKLSDFSVVDTYPRMGEDGPSETGTVNGVDLATVTGANMRSTFNPHGVVIDEAADVMLTSDAVQPSSLQMGPPQFRPTLRVWELSTRKLVQTVPVCVGGIGAQFVKGSNGTEAFVSCDAGGEVWHLAKDTSDGGTGQWSAEKVDITWAAPTGMMLGPVPGLLATGTDGKSLYVTQSDPGRVFKLDTTNSATSPTVAATATTGAGTHFMSMSADGSRLFATDYVSQLAEASGLPPHDGKVWAIDTATMTPVELDTSTDENGTALPALNPHMAIPYGGTH